MRFSGRTAIVAGGARGIGAATVRALIGEGAKVVIGDILEDQGERLAGELGADARFAKLDVTSSEAWADAVAVAQVMGRLTILINTAGIAVTGAFDQEGIDDWRLNMAVNAEGVLLGCQATAPVIHANGGGSIVNFSSTAGVRTRSEMSSYGAAKAAVSLLTQHVALRCAELGWKVRANAIVPGPIRTEMMENSIKTWLEMGRIGSMDEGFGFMAAATPMKRIADPAEVARAALFLASDDASFVTGALLPVDGGMCAM
jgi:3alpha(or 20beta)-hydroxysteroid dehydrogenase